MPKKPVLQKKAEAMEALSLTATIDEFFKEADGRIGIGDIGTFKVVTEIRVEESIVRKTQL